MKLVNFLLTFGLVLGVTNEGRSLDLGSKKFFQGKLFTDLASSKKHEQIHKEIPALWFDGQKVNHFDTNDNRIWPQKYYLNRSFYHHGAPVFISLGGEGPLSNYDVTSSAVAELGKKLNCFLITVEHRFYGESQPTNDTSADNLRLLTSQQALADFSEIINFIKQKYNLTENKWIAFGCSYAGNLAAWIRIRYPHLIYAAVASSAPVEAKFYFQEYFEKVGQTILETSSECYWTLNDAFTGIRSLLQTDTCCPPGNTLTDSPTSILKETFGLCKELNTSDELEVESFYSALVSYWASVAQYNGVGNGYILGGLSIDYLCQIMRTPLNASHLSQNHLLLRKMQRRKPLKSTLSNMVDFLKDDQWTSTGVQYGMRQWIWQTCSEFAYFQTLKSSEQPFGNALTEKNFVAICRLAYGEKYDELFTKNAVASANNIYGGKTGEGSRIIFVNGDNDPWSPLGLNRQDEANDDNIVISLQGKAHCSNGYQTLTGDTQDLMKAKERIFETLKFWLGLL